MTATPQGDRLDDDPFGRRWVPGQPWCTSCHASGHLYTECSVADDEPTATAACPSVSPYWDLQCDLPDTREAHPMGHEHKRRMSATRFDTETVVWGTSDADDERWGDG